MAATAATVAATAASAAKERARVAAEYAGVKLKEEAARRAVRRRKTAEVEVRAEAWRRCLHKPQPLKPKT